MKRIIVSACGAALAVALLAAPAQANIRHFHGTVEHGGKIAFDVKFRDGKPKLAGNFDVSGLLVTCDQGNTRRHISTSNVVSVTHRVFSYRFQGFKAKIYGKLNRKGNRAAGNVSYGPNSPEPQHTNCSTDGNLHWTAEK